MQDEISFPARDGKRKTQKQGLEKQSAWLAWFPEENREIIVLSHQSQHKIKVSGKVKLK